MKNFVLCNILIGLLFSCSPDSDLAISDKEQHAIAKTTSNFTDPAYIKNPFDFKGKKYYDGLKTYSCQNDSPKSIAAITDQIRFLSKFIRTGNSTQKNSIVFTDEIVQAIMSDPDNSMIAIVEDSDLSPSAKTSLIAFLQGLIEQRQLEFSVSYSYIVQYEDQIIGDNLWSDDDSETILTITSISRYSLYSESERKDRDWDKSSGNKKAQMFKENEITIISILSLLSLYN